jgi:hypothetical protein
MRKQLLLTYGIAVFACLAARALPTAGTYSVTPPGVWQEWLQNGQPGTPGNEIGASSPFYSFSGATIAQVEPDATQQWDWITVYTGGELVLKNVARAPWAALCDPAEEFTFQFDQVVVKTRSTRFIGTPDQGKLEFELSGRSGGVAVWASYSGVPTATPDNQGNVIVSDELDAVHIAIHLIEVDVKPGSCPNPLNVKSKGVLPVAILGTTPNSSRSIDPASIRLAYMGRSIAPLRWNIEGVCDDEGSLDRCPDISLKFDTEAIVRMLGPVLDRQVIALTLNAALRDGTMVSGQDRIIILNGGQAKGRR